MQSATRCSRACFACIVIACEHLRGKTSSLAQVVWLQAQPPVLAMRMVQLLLTARLWQQPCQQKTSHWWPLGREVSGEVLHKLSSSARGLQVPGGRRNLRMVRRQV